MKEVEPTLAPTLWRTFRAVASVNRLRCLKVVLKRPGISVELVAGATCLTEPKVSLALRALQSRGLIAFERRSRWVMYNPGPEPSVRAAKRFLVAMKDALITKEMSEEEIARTAKAYTHPRRINIVRALAFTGPIDPVELASEVQISPQAFTRHLRKLKALGVVHKSERLCALSKPKTKLAHDLLRIVLE